MGVIVTLQGQALFAQAAAQGGTAVPLAAIAVGDGNGAAITPVETATQLVREVYRTGVQSAVTDPQNANYIIVTAVIPANAGPFTIREIGLFASNGQLVAIADYPDTRKNTTAQGVDTTLTIELVLVVSETAQVTLVAHPGSWATQDYVDQRIPQFATIPEHLAGTISTKTAHPAGVAAMINAAVENLPDPLELANGPEHLAGTSSAKATHPAGVKSMIDAAVAALPPPQGDVLYRFETLF